MSKEYPAKIFRSGNSMALRLPKAAGFAEGDDVVIVPHTDRSFTILKANTAQAVLEGLAGRLSPDFMAAGRGDIDQDERDWRSGGAEQAA